MNVDKSTLYRTAQATIACVGINVGDYVSVEFSHQTDNGTRWFKIERTQNGPLASPVIYPEHHLDNFVL